MIRTISRKIWACTGAREQTENREERPLGGPRPGLLLRLLRLLLLLLPLRTLASHSIPATEMPRRRMTVMVPMIRMSLILSVMMAPAPCQKHKGPHDSSHGTPGAT